MVRTPRARVLILRPGCKCFRRFIDKQGKLHHVPPWEMAVLITPKYMTYENRPIRHDFPKVCEILNIPIAPTAWHSAGADLGGMLVDRREPTSIRSRPSLR